MERKNTYICIDIEAAFLRGRQHIIEIGAVKLFPSGETETFSQLIRPHKFKRLNQHIQRLTGIMTEDLVEAPAFKEAVEAFRAWCGECCVFLTFGEFDRKVLEEELIRNAMDTRFMFPMVDFQQKWMIANQVKEQPSLSGMMEQLDLHVETKHRALADADSLCQIFVACNGEELIESQKTNVLKVLLSSLRPMETHYALMLSVITCHVYENGIDIEKKETLFERLTFTVKERTRVNKEGQEEIVQVTTIHPNDRARQLLEETAQNISGTVVLTKNGMRSLSKILKLHNVALPKTEMMSLQAMLNEEKVAAFQVIEHEVAHYEAKVCALLKRHERAIVQEFEKRAMLLPVRSDKE